MDVTLPGIDGLEATRRIRALGGKPGATSIIGISGRSEPGDREAARAAGMNAYLRKPLSPSMLREAIGAAMATSTNARRTSAVVLDRLLGLLNNPARRSLSSGA